MLKHPIDFQRPAPQSIEAANSTRRSAPFAWACACLFSVACATGGDLGTTGPAEGNPGGTGGSSGGAAGSGNQPGVGGDGGNTTSPGGNSGVGGNTQGGNNLGGSGAEPGTGGTGTSGGTSSTGGTDTSGGTGGTDTSGGTGGTGGNASCDNSTPRNQCATAENLGGHCGDSACILLACLPSSGTLFKTVTGSSSAFFRLTSQECSECWPSDLLAEANLTVPAGVNYDLYLWSSSSCSGTPIAKSEQGTGIDETVYGVVGADEIPGIDEVADYWLEVRHVDGNSCAEWRLDIIKTDESSCP